MKLIDLVEAEKVKGTYAGVRFDQATIDDVATYITDNNIPNAISPDKLHCTLLYSEKHCPEYVAKGEIKPPYSGTPEGLEVWKSAVNGNQCLVLKFKCPELVERHKALMKEHDAAYGFDEYKTHLTLSYDIGEMDISGLPAYKGDIKIVKEYQEDLEVDWAKDNS